MKEVVPNIGEISTKHIRLTKVDWELVKEYVCGLYVEVGTFHGASACAAVHGGASKVITIDVYDWQPKVYQSDKITFFKGTSVDFVKRYASRKKAFVIDTLFVDGSHEFEYVMKDCESLIPFVRKGGTVLFHDHNPNNPNTGVYKAVNKYLADIKHRKFPKVEGSGNMLVVQIQ